MIRQRSGRYRRRAGVVVQVMICSTVMLGMSALVVDVGAVYTTQTELQAAADAAALAAAAHLAGEGEQDSVEAATAAADDYARRNPVTGNDVMVSAEDVEFGRAQYDPTTEKFAFQTATTNYDAVRVTVRRTTGNETVGVPLLFAGVFGEDFQALEAKAAAVLIPRDISVVIDLSNSMCWDSQLRYWDRADEGYSNLRDVWCALDGPEPEKPYVPATASDVDQTEYVDDTGPTIGVMSEWGDALFPDTYDATTDPGLYYLPRATDWSGNTEVEQLLIDQGYNEWERWAILTNETQGYLTSEQTDCLGFSSRVVWEQNSSSGRDLITIYLTSDGTGSTPALSHLTVSLPYCARSTARSTARSEGGYPVSVVSPDPKTGYSGIKFDETSLGEDGRVETESFSFEVPSTCGVRDVDVVTKAGRYYCVENQAFESVDPWNLTRWRYRVAAVLGLAQWNSGMNGSGGDDDGMIEGSAELAWIAKPSFRVDWSWTNYIDWVRSGGRRAEFRYRYGLKTFTDFLLENEPCHWETNNLWATPEQPLRAVKDAVKSMVDVITALDSMDHVSLEIFAQSARHEVDLTDNLALVPATLYERQSGHYDRMTNIGGGLARAYLELTSERARESSAKVIVLMSDGVPNIDENGNSVSDGSQAACDYALDVAQMAADEGFRVYTVSVGYNVDRELLQEIATIGNGQEFYAAGNPDEYTDQLEMIFRALGGKRPVALIE